MNHRLLSVTLLLVMLTGGCAAKNDKTGIRGAGLTYQSEVKEMKNGDFFTEVEAAPLAGQGAGAVAQANENATAYCQSRHQKMEEVKTEIDSHLLVNGVARLTFRCIP